MAEPIAQPGPGNEMPRANLRPSRRSWLLWLVPLGALALCGWFLYHDYIAAGPLITIYFQTAEGLEEGTTPVSYRGAEAGRVKSVRLTKDRRRVEVKARLAASAKELARVGSVFWIVRPEVKVGSVSGLRTLISGEYVTVLPGDGPRTNVFVGVERPSGFEPAQGLEIALLTQELGSLQEQSPVFFRGIQVGEVRSYQLGPDSRAVIVRAVIRKEYAPLVRTNSKFWNAGGFDIRAGLFKGLEISAESVKTLLAGGIAFATPPEPGEPVPRGAAFELYDKPEEAWKKWTVGIKLNLLEQAPETPQTAGLLQR
jgi:paraquat-inducible protein B